jgi:S-formylglutathione hydrolase FrmB
MLRLALPAIPALVTVVLVCLGESRPATALRFEVALADGLVAGPIDGRLLVVLDRGKEPEPWRTIGTTGMTAPPLLGRDVKGLTPATAAVVDQSAVIFPIASLGQLPRGEYRVQAVLDVSRDLKLVYSSGNLLSDPVTVHIDPARGGVVRLTLNRQFREEDLPDTEHLRFVKLRSEKLSRFHGRPMYLRAGVLLPAGYGRDPDRRYPLRVHIGGYGTRFSELASWMQEDDDFRKFWLDPATPRMVLLHLDGAGPYGDPYQVNSANNGPYGDAVTGELIPYVERTFRCIGAPHARFLDGASTGGWVSLALQVFYPDFFNGAWSHAPDPVDFRAYELINIYEDENAYVNAFGFERPAMRTLRGDVRYTVRHEVLLERILGRGDRWELSGKDWCAWNATFGPRGADGLPRPLWDGATGKLDRDVLEHWKRYDLRRVLQNDWANLGPKLRGKLHVWVGEADDYFLNNAVHLLDDFLRKARPAYEGSITYALGQGHDYTGISRKAMMEAMARRVAGGSR